MCSGWSDRHEDRGWLCRGSRSLYVSEDIERSGGWSGGNPYRTGWNEYQCKLWFDAYGWIKSQSSLWKCCHWYCIWRGCRPYACCGWKRRTGRWRPDHGNLWYLYETERYLKKEYDRCYCYDKPWIFTDGRTRRHPCGKDKSWRQICSWKYERTWL